MKNRQPLSEIFVVSDMKLDEEYGQIVCEELNVRTIKCLEDAGELVDYKLKPQLRTCGRKFGPKLNAAKEVIANLNGKEIVSKVKEGPVTITVDGEDFEMNEEDFLVETVQPEGLSTQEDKGITVSLNIVLTDDLIEDGFVREMISKIQTQRKETGLEVVDRIILSYSGNDKLKDIIEKKKEFIASEVLASEIKEGEGSNMKEWSINGENIFFNVEKA